MQLASIVNNINKADPEKLSYADAEEWRLITETLNNVKGGIITASPWITVSAEDVNRALKIASDRLESPMIQLPDDRAWQEALIKIREDFPDSLLKQAKVIEYISKDLLLLNNNPTAFER